MARPRKRTEPTKASGLLNALKFLSSITKEVGSPLETHVVLHDKWAIASNGIMSAGHKIEEELSAGPNNHLLIEALSKCKNEFSITQLDNNRLAISSGKFKANVPCIAFDTISIPQPDQPIAVINDELKKAIEATAVLANRNGEYVYNRSVLLNGQSVVSTNGRMLIEYWHGIDLPTNISIPEQFEALLQNDKVLSRFGFSNSSITFWFEDGSWIKSQIFAEKWPDLGKVLNIPVNPVSVPKELFVGLDAVAPFASDDLVRFKDGCIKSNDEQASYEVSGLPNGPVFNAKQLGLLKDWVETADWFGPAASYFFGGRFRAVIAGRTQ